MRHTHERRHPLTVLQQMLYAPCGGLTALESFGKDVLFGFPSARGSIVETALQVGIAGAVIGLHHAIVKVFGQFGFHIEGHAVDNEQVGRATLGSDELA